MTKMLQSLKNMVK